MDISTFYIRLSAQRALLGAVPFRLRAVSVEIEGSIVRMKGIFDSGCTECDKEVLFVAGTEIIADFPSSFNIEEECLVVPHPQPMEHLTHLVYLRHEPSFNRDA
jgi:hypothetical protein